MSFTERIGCMFSIRMPDSLFLLICRWLNFHNISLGQINTGGSEITHDFKLNQFIKLWSFAFQLRNLHCGPNPHNKIVRPQLSLVIMLRLADDHMQTFRVSHSWCSWDALKTALIYKIGHVVHFHFNFRRAHRLTLIGSILIWLYWSSASTPSASRFSY